MTLVKFQIKSGLGYHPALPTADERSCSFQNPFKSLVGNSYPFICQFCGSFRTNLIQTKTSIRSNHFLFHQWRWPSQGYLILPPESWGIPFASAWRKSARPSERSCISVPRRIPPTTTPLGSEIQRVKWDDDVKFGGSWVRSLQIETLTKHCELFFELGYDFFSDPNVNRIMWINDCFLAHRKRKNSIPTLWFFDGFRQKCTWNFQQKIQPEMKQVYTWNPNTLKELFWLKITLFWRVQLQPPK